MSLQLSEFKNLINLNKKTKPKIDNKFVFEMENKKSKNKKVKNWRNATNELAMFNVKPETIIVNVDVNNNNEVDCHVETEPEPEPFINYETKFEVTQDEEDDSYLFNSHNDEKILESIYNLNRRLYFKYLNQYNVKEIKQSGLKNSNQIRSKKDNKRIKLKTLLKTDNFIPQLTRTNLFDINNNSINYDLFKYLKFDSTLIKGNSRLHIKYNIYNKLFIVDSFSERFNVIEYFYIKKLDRTMHTYALRKSNAANLSELKTTSRERLRNMKTKPASTQQQQQQQQQQENLPVLNVFTIDHNRVNAEITANYDQMYVEFLISLQHREITPEDYEELARLDELIKKKTVSENKLSKLKCETVNESNVCNFENDLCSICMEPYMINQTRKHLPCGHVFHGECIDMWLSSNSTKCPLDQLSVDVNDAFSRSISIMSDHI